MVAFPFDQVTPVPLLLLTVVAPLVQAQPDAPGDVQLQRESLVRRWLLAACELSIEDYT
jgi:hypothetical protein